MAQEIYRESKRLYVPTYEPVGKMLIDPNKPPMEELWRFLRTCVQVWLCKSKIFSASREEIEDLEQRCLFEAYKVFKRNVLTKTYRLEYSLYLNVRSACWEATHKILEQYWRDKRNHRDITLSLNECMLDDGTEYINSISHAYTFLTESDKTAKKRKDPNRVMKSDIVDAYWKYVESCYEMGILDVLDEDAWIEKNFSTREQPDQRPTQEPQTR